MILYVVRLCARFDSHLAFLLSYDAGTHDSIRGRPFRGLDLSPSNREALSACRAELRSVMWAELRPILLGWYHRLSRELESDPEDEVRVSNPNTTPHPQPHPNPSPTRERCGSDNADPPSH